MDNMEERKMEMRSRVSGQMKYWMRIYKMDVAELAEKTGMAENSIYRLRRCESGATVDTLILLADAFDIPAFMFLMPVESSYDPDGDE